MRKWKDDIKRYLREICQGYMNCIDLAQDRGNWRNFVQTVMNFESSTKCRESVPQLRQYQLLKKGKFGSSHYFRHFLPSRKKCLLARHIRLSVCLSARIVAGSTGRISTKFDTGDFFYEYLSR